MPTQCKHTCTRQNGGGGGPDDQKVAFGPDGNLCSILDTSVLGRCRNVSESDTESYPRPLLEKTVADLHNQEIGVNFLLRAFVRFQTCERA